MRQKFIPIAVFAVALVLSIGMVSGGYGVAAQNGTGTPGTANGTAAEAAHPGHIHTGTCDAVGDVVYPLNDATASDMTGTPDTGANATSGSGANETSDTGANETSDTGGNETAGTDDTADDTGSDDMDMGQAEVVAESVTTIEASLDDILGAEHVVNFHESAENIGNYIACGALTGTADDQGTLEIALDEQNDSGFEGSARLVDSGDGSIEVTIQLWHANGDDIADDTGSDTTGGTGDESGDDTGDDDDDDND